MVSRLLFENTWPRSRLMFIVTTMALAPKWPTPPPRPAGAAALAVIGCSYCYCCCCLSSLRRGRGRRGAPQEGATPIVVFHTSVGEPRAAATGLHPQPSVGGWCRTNGGRPALLRRWSAAAERMLYSTASMRPQPSPPPFLMKDKGARTNWRVAGDALDCPPSPPPPKATCPYTSPDHGEPLAS